LIVAVTLTPFVPLSLKGAGEDFEEGLTPLLDTPYEERKIREWRLRFSCLSFSISLLTRGRELAG